MKTAMFGIMVEGEQLADVHYELREKLMNEVHQSVNQWKKDNYHKSLMNYKEVKNSEEGFSKAQKPWARRLDEGSCILLFKTLSNNKVDFSCGLCESFLNCHVCLG